MVEGDSPDGLVGPWRGGNVFFHVNLQVVEKRAIRPLSGHNHAHQHPAILLL